MAESWTIVAEPVGDNSPREDEKNRGGIVIFTVRGPTKQEVSRVAYARRHSKNPDVKFDKQLAVEMDKARTSVRLLNQMAETAGELQ